MTDARSEDARARSLAQREFERPVVIEAGAGTGKTACLVARTLGWALGPGWERVARESQARDERIGAEVLARIAAITFTEAAAAEMGERVGTALETIASGALPVGVEAEALPADPDERRRRAVALRGALDQLRVQTIHAFCRRILAEHPVEAGLHPHFVVDADETAQGAAVRRVLEEALPALFDESPELLVLVRAGCQVHDLEEALHFLLREGVEPAALRQDPLDATAVAALAGRLTPRVRDFVSLDGGRLASLGSRAKKVSAVAEQLAALGDALPKQGGDLAALCSQVGEVDEGVVKKWSAGDFGKRGAELLGEDAAPLVERAAALLPLLRHVQRIDEAVLRAGRAILLPLYERLVRRLRAGGIETFQALLADTRALLRDDARVRGLTQRAFDQLLVDEFQDTDPVQCDIVRCLALEGPRSARPGLFLVGDPKQSIYGWRRADLAAYEAFVAEVVDAGGERASLVVNHRSTPRVLDEVARLFRPTLVHEPGVQPAFEPLLPAEGAADTPLPDGRAAIEYWVNWKWDAETGEPVATRAAEGDALEAAAVAADVAGLGAEGVAWKEIALLFRAGTALEPVLHELRRRGVPFAVEGDRSYYERREVVEASALLRCILDPNDQVALLCVLRSGLVGVPDAALLPLWQEGFPARAAALHGSGAVEREGLGALIERAHAALPADVPGIERVDGWPVSLRALLVAIALLRESFERDPADVFVDKLRGLTLFEVGEASRYLGAYRLANLDRFFRDLMAALYEAEGDPEALIQALRRDVAERREREEGRPREAVADAVQVMTIHRAKGLDFDHVYVLQMQRGRQRGSSPRAEMIDGRLELELFGVPTLGYDRVTALREAVERAEGVRTLYVATTRARRRLVLSGVHPERAVRPSEASHTALLARRENGLPRLVDEASRCDPGGAEATFVFDDARFVFTAQHREGPVVLAARGGAGIEPATVAREVEHLASRRTAAARAQARPRHTTMSAPAEARGDDAVAVPDADARAAALAGTLVHQVLEQLDLEADLRAELAHARRLLPERVVAGAPSALGAAVQQRADAVLAKLAQGALAERLAGLAPHVVARELDVFLPPGPEGAVAFVSGAIDLLYRDPTSGEWVVADYKTDRIVDAADLEAKRARYAAQGENYVAAVRDALQLPEAPRFELWFLDADEIVVA